MLYTCDKSWLLLCLAATYTAHCAWPPPPPPMIDFFNQSPEHTHRLRLYQSCQTRGSWNPQQTFPDSPDHWLRGWPLRTTTTTNINCLFSGCRGTRCDRRTHLYDVEELVPVDAAVAVHVVEFEIPAQLVLHLPAHHQAKGRHVLHEVDVAVLQTPARTTRQSTGMLDVIKTPPKEGHL